MAHPELDRTMSAVNAVGFLALAEAILAAWHRRKVPTILGVAASMAFTLYGWRRYADLYDGDENPI